MALTSVIFYTAHYHDSEARRLAKACQVDEVLAKPCDATRLLETVALALGARSTQAKGVTEEFDRNHLRLLTNKLAQKVQELQLEIEQRSLAEERVRKLNRVYAVLSGINSLIVRVSSREELCNGACRLAVDQGRFRVAWIGLREAGGDVIRTVAWSGESGDLWPADGIALNGPQERSGMVSSALSSHLPVVVNDFRSSMQPLLHRDELLARGYRT